MSRQELPRESQRVLAAAFRLGETVEAAAVILIAERCLDFAKVKAESGKLRLIVSSDDEKVTRRLARTTWTLSAFSTNLRLVTSRYLRCYLRR
ncbi:MAG UNVERIFIED_CONTAM: hypothetical protein LVR18_49540 [Planctomycetaceae bacterium]|jgi:hypothetical protein